MKKKLPKDFKGLFWGYNFRSIDPFNGKKLVVVNTLNYGDLKQWRYLVRFYGKRDLQKTIMDIPESEFRKQIVKLIKLLFGIRKFNYASRSVKIKTERGL